MQFVRKLYKEKGHASYSTLTDVFPHKMF